MIKKITIRDVASYDSEGVVLDDLQKVNFVFGGNGTGKTTLSRVLGSENIDVEYPGCHVEWEGSPKKVLVYNKDFKERNIKESMPGVFMLGEEWIAAEGELKDIHSQIKHAADIVKKANNDAVKADKALEEEKAAVEERLWNEVHEKYKEFEKCFENCNSKPTFAERLMSEVNKWNALGDVGAEEYRMFAPTIDELRKQNNKLYEGKYSKLGPDNPMSGQIFFERELLTRDLWQYIVAEVHEMVTLMVNKVKELEAIVDEKDEELGGAQHMLSMIESRMTDAVDMVTSVRPCMDHINSILASKGMMNFSIQPSPILDNYYQIQRADGSFVKDTLSEGEASLITFLYFMEQVRGYRMTNYLSDLEVVVIDDPISSMDHEVMYTVSEMVHDLLDDVRSKDYKGAVKQVFVMTHNVAFHQAVSDRQIRKHTGYWILSKDIDVSEVTAYGGKNPVKSDYEELWARLKEAKENRNSIVMPNLMRRIIETYFVWYGGYEKRKLLTGGYAKNREDEIVIAGLSKWFDEESHGVRGDVYAGSGQAICGRCMEAFRMFFVKMGQGAHYEMMMREHQDE